MSSDSDSNPFSPGPSDRPFKTPDDSKEVEKKPIKKEKVPDEESKEASTSKTDGAVEKKELASNFKDDETELGFSNSFLEAKLATYKTKNQLETEDREKMQ
ncbi:hypothetical protein L1887_61122 [Cichorium endivia]|nr:hypothetical protein L1887_61122 [Cichorium endivia]